MGPKASQRIKYWRFILKCCIRIYYLRVLQLKLTMILVNLVTKCWVRLVTASEADRLTTSAVISLCELVICWAQIATYTRRPQGAKKMQWPNVFRTSSMHARVRVLTKLQHDSGPRFTVQYTITGCKPADTHRLLTPLARPQTWPPVLHVRSATVHNQSRSTLQVFGVRRIKAAGSWTEISK